MRIVMHSTLPHDDVRAHHAARVLQGRGHEVVFVAGTHAVGSDLEPVARRFGAPTYTARHGANLIAAFDAVGADVVWCHALRAYWAYASSATLTPKIETQILRGAPLAETDWTCSRGRAALVYDAHEYESDRPHEWHRPRAVADWIEREVRAIPVADAVVTVSAGIANLLEAKRLRADRPHVVTNAPFAPRRPLRTREAYEKIQSLLPAEVRDCPIVAFAGAPTLDRDLATLATALCRTKERWAFFALSSFDVPHAHARVHAPYPWPEVEGLHMLDYLAACDLAWNGAWIEYASWAHGAPNKMYEYGMAGVPQLAPRGMHEFERLEREYEIGKTFGDALDLVALLDGWESCAPPFASRARQREPRAFRDAEDYEVKNAHVLEHVLETVARK